MIPIKQIHTNRSKACSSVSCTLFAFMVSWFCFVLPLPISRTTVRLPGFIQCYRVSVQGKPDDFSAIAIGKKGLMAPQPSLSGHVFQPCFSPQLTNYKVSFSLKDEGLFHANSCRKRTATAGDFLQEAASGLAGDCQRS